MGSFWIAEGGDSVLLQLITAKLVVLEEANCGDRYSCTTENGLLLLALSNVKKKRSNTWAMKHSIVEGYGLI